MRDHTVTVGQAEAGPKLTFAPVFNAAIAFIDRHLDEGRGNKLAICSASDEVTYAQLAERVNRLANVLRNLGGGRGERLLMVVKDRPEFFYLFWGAVKAGLVPVAVNTLLRAEDYQFLITDSGAAIVVYSPDLAEPIEVALAALEDGPAHALTAHGDGSVVDLMAAASIDFEAAPTAPEDDCFWL